MKAFQEVNAEINDWKLLIIGEGPEKKKIKNLIEKSNLKDKVSLMGTISREEVADELTTSKIYLINSIQEGLPKSLIEAMASGCACISSDAGECESVIDSAAFLLKQNILSTKDAIAKLIRDQRLSSELSKKPEKNQNNTLGKNILVIKLTQGIYQKIMKLQEFEKKTHRGNKLINDKLHFFSSKSAVIISFILFKLKFSANQVTFLFGLTGILSANLFLHKQFIIGYLLWRLHIIIDMADGNIARASKNLIYLRQV